MVHNSPALRLFYLGVDHAEVVLRAQLWPLLGELPPHGLFDGNDSHGQLWVCSKEKTSPRDLWWEVRRDNELSIACWRPLDPTDAAGFFDPAF